MAERQQHGIRLGDAPGSEPGSSGGRGTEPETRSPDLDSANPVVKVWRATDWRRPPATDQSAGGLQIEARFGRFAAVAIETVGLENRQHFLLKRIREGMSGA